MELSICDMCGKKLPFKVWGDRNVYFPFKLGKRKLWLGIHVYQGKPDRRRRERWGHGRRHLDLCKACTLKAVLAARRAWKGPTEAVLLNPHPRKRRPILKTSR